MTPLKFAILIIVCLGLLGCRDPNPEAIPSSGNRVRARPQIRGLRAKSAPRREALVRRRLMSRRST